MNITLFIASFLFMALAITCGIAIFKSEIDLKPFLIGYLGAAILFVAAATAITGSDTPGIVPHPSGEAVMIHGDACVVNHVDDRDQFRDLLRWCLAQYPEEQ